MNPPNGFLMSASTLARSVQNSSESSDASTIVAPVGSSSAKAAHQTKNMSADTRTPGSEFAGIVLPPR